MNFQPARVFAAVWASVFAALHGLWASGSTLGLGAAARTELTGWFLGYDVVVAVACLVGVAIALWGRRWMLIAVTALLGVRGLLGVGQFVLGLLRGADVWSATLWVEPFFVLGAVLFGVVAGRRQRAHRREHVTVDG